MVRHGTDGHNMRRAGFTLVELMVSLFIVGIVMMGWWRIMNATSPYREAQRRAAVEVAAGVLDIFPSAKIATNWKVDDSCGFSVESGSVRQRFPDSWMPSDASVRYVLVTTNISVQANAGDWMRWGFARETDDNRNNWWAIMELYDSEDPYTCQKPFAVLKQLVNIE